MFYDLRENCDGMDGAVRDGSIALMPEKEWNRPDDSWIKIKKIKKLSHICPTYAIMIKVYREIKVR